MPLLNPIPFDYGTLADGDLAIVRDAETAIRLHRRRACDEAIAIGRELIRVKAILPHGGFERWIETAFGFVPRTATNFIHMATNLAGKSEIISDLPPTLMYRVAAPSITEVTRALLLAPREDGEKLTAVDVSQRLYDHQQSEKQKAADAKLTPKQRANRRSAAKREEREKINWEEQSALARKKRDEAACRLATLIREKFTADEIAEVKMLMMLAFSTDVVDRLGG